jgi:hypothetical protein
MTPHESLVNEAEAWLATCVRDSRNGTVKRAVDLVERLLSALRSPPREVGWRCFHCDEVFTDWGAARNHFGWEPKDGAPVCRVDGGTAALIYHLTQQVKALGGKPYRAALSPVAEVVAPVASEGVEARRDLEVLRGGLDNVRYYAAKHRKQPWARDVLSILSDAGVKASPLRNEPPAAQPEPEGAMVCPICSREMRSEGTRMVHECLIGEMTTLPTLELNSLRGRLHSKTELADSLLKQLEERANKVTSIRPTTPTNDGEAKSE